MPRLKQDPERFASQQRAEAVPEAVPIPLNRPDVGAEELAAMAEALRATGGYSAKRFVRLCEAQLTADYAPAHALLTHSCSAALELAMLSLDLRPGDEVIMPSFTFVSTANAVALRGAVPVFVDLRPDTLNIDERLVEDAVTERTRAIVPVHYGGVACEMDALLEIAARRGLAVVEDAAQAFGATYRGRPLGSLGTMGAISFHETKNVVAGEGGCLLVRDPDLLDKVLVGRDKGTNKAAFQEGRVAEYSWTGLGSAYAMHEMAAALLHAQLIKARQITARRLSLWQRYRKLLQPLADGGRIQLPTVPEECGHNGHVFYILAGDRAARDALLRCLNDAGVSAAFHYIPLHGSAGGMRYSRTHGTLAHTESCASRILRLPLFPGLLDEQQDRICELLAAALEGDRRSAVGQVRTSFRSDN